MPSRYGMVTDIRNMPALSQLQSAGITPLFGGNDPGGIQAIQAAMAAAQGNAGLWIPADSRSPQEYVDWVRQLMAAAPQAKHIDLNMEAIATGAPGTPGWNYSEDVLSQLAPDLAGREWSVSPMANQDWYNYQAATSRGGQIWPQAYQGDMSGIDPQGVIDWVKRNNVPANMITPLLGNASQAGLGNLYGIDLPGFRNPGGQFMVNPDAHPYDYVTPPPFTEGAADNGLGITQYAPVRRGVLPSRPTGKPLSQVYLSSTGRGPRILPAIKPKVWPTVVKKGYQTYAPEGVPFNPERQIKIGAPLPAAFRPIANPYKSTV